MIEASDGRGQVVEYTRDYLGRVTGKVPQGLATQAVEYVWDTGGLSGSYGVGRLAKVIDGSGTTLFRYDHHGNLTAKQQTIGTTTSALLAYEYDLADRITRITRITYPSGRLVQYGYDGKGRVNLVKTQANAGVGSWTVIASDYTYEPFGAVAAMTLGNGLAVANDWGNDGRLASRRLYRTSDNTSLSYLSTATTPTATSPRSPTSSTMRTRRSTATTRSAGWSWRWPTAAAPGRKATATPAAPTVSPR